MNPQPVKKRGPKKPPPQKLDPAMLRAIEAVAERAAKRAVTRAMRDVKELLLSIGVNAETPSGVIENQKDAAWLRRVRLSAESTPAKLSLALFGAGLSIIGGLILLVTKHIVETYIWK